MLPSSSTPIRTAPPCRLRNATKSMTRRWIERPSRLNSKVELSPWSMSPTNLCRSIHVPQKPVPSTSSSAGRRLGTGAPTVTVSLER